MSKDHPYNCPTDIGSAKRRIDELLDFIDELRRTHAGMLRDAEREVQAHRFEAAAAEWALVGIAAARAHVAWHDNGAASHLNSPEFVRVVAMEMSQRLLHQAKLAFRDHAHAAEMMRHIAYLEGHARSNGLAFRPFDHADPDELPAQIDWPTTKREPFAGPLTK